MNCYSWMDSVFGRVLITGDGEAVSGLFLGPWEEGEEIKQDRNNTEHTLHKQGGANASGIFGHHVSGKLPSAYNKLYKEPFTQEKDAFSKAKEELRAYWAGRLKRFTVPLIVQGTAFQMSVWEVLRGIPFGRWISYGDVANKLGRPGAVRAVGGAIGRNPVSIIIPCHRVLGSRGQLTGFGGGLEKKAGLLKHEGLHPEPAAQLRDRRVTAGRATIGV